MFKKNKYKVLRGAISKELASFNKGELDFVWGVPVEEIPNIMGTLDEAKEGKNAFIEKRRPEFEKFPRRP